LQPVQLVSMEPAPGVIAKIEFEDLAVTRPPHPAATSSAGARSNGKCLKMVFRTVAILTPTYRILYRLWMKAKKCTQTEPLCQWEAAFFTVSRWKLMRKLE
jgi:hypothetical protein